MIFGGDQTDRDTHVRSVPADHSSGNGASAGAPHPVIHIPFDTRSSNDHWNRPGRDH